MFSQPAGRESCRYVQLMMGLRRSTMLGVPALAVVAAATDALSYLGLGKVFPANMTGNTVLLGIGIAEGDWGAALHSVCALGGFVLAAVLVGCVPVPRRGARSLRSALVVELLLLGGLAAWWLLLGPYPSSGPRYGLIVLAGMAMGTQSATVAWLQLPSLSTTYITGTWTSVAGWVGTVVRAMLWPQVDDDHKRVHRLQVGMLVAYALGALGTGYSFRGFSERAVLIPLVVLAMVVAASMVVTVHRLPRAEGGE